MMCQNAGRRMQKMQMEKEKIYHKTRRGKTHRRLHARHFISTFQLFPKRTNIQLLPPTPPRSALILMANMQQQLLHFSPSSLNYKYNVLSEEEINQHVELIFEKGYTIVPNAIPPALLKELQILANDHENVFVERKQKLNLKYKNVYGRNAPYSLSCLPGLSPYYCDLAIEPNILRIVKKIVGDDCLLGSTTFTNPRSNEQEQEWHTDDLLYGRDLFKRPLDNYLNINTITAIDDYTDRNGATKLFPGSHRWKSFPPRGNAPRRSKDPIFSPVNQKYESEFALQNPSKKFVQAVMKAGSTVFWLGATWHCKGPNITKPNEVNARRPTAIIQYCRGNLRPQENLMIQLKHELVATMKPDMQRLVGYDTTVEGLGFSQYGSPAALLGEGGNKLLEIVQKRARTVAVENYKRLLGHIDEYERSEKNVVLSDEEQLKELERRNYTLSQKIYELKKKIQQSKI